MDLHDNERKYEIHLVQLTDKGKEGQISLDIIYNKSWGTKKSAKNSPASLSEFQHTDDGEITWWKLRIGQAWTETETAIKPPFWNSVYCCDVTTQEQKISSLAQGKFRQEQRPLNLRDKHFPSQ